MQYLLPNILALLTSLCYLTIQIDLFRISREKEQTQCLAKGFDTLWFMKQFSLVRRLTVNLRSTVTVPVMGVSCGKEGDIKNQNLQKKLS